MLLLEARAKHLEYSLHFSDNRRYCAIVLYHNPNIQFMKTSLIAVIVLILLNFRAHAQTVDEICDSALTELDNQNMDAGIAILDKAVAMYPANHKVWLYRGAAKASVYEFHDAIDDLTKAINLKPSLVVAYGLRAEAKKSVTDYDGAIEDFTNIIRMAPSYEKAYYGRGKIYELLGKKNEACNDCDKAYRLGDRSADRKVKKCHDTSSIETYPILRLVDVAEDSSYGVTEENPIMVGIGPDGGPANERAYLNLLRDPLGHAVAYERTGSCCMYESPNGLLGYALLDVYELSYHDINGEPQTIKVYISMYDYETPKILSGFQTVYPQRIRKP